MTRRYGGAARGLVFAVVLVVAAAGYYNYRQTTSSHRIKSEMLAIFDDMQLPPDWRDEVANLFPAAHKQAYANAVDIKKKHGQKFNAREYYDEVFDLIIRWSNEDGKGRLAERLETDRRTFVLRVTEQ